MGLRLASLDTKRIELSDGAWIEVTSDISKRDFMDIMTAMPDSAVSADGDSKVTLSIKDAASFQSLLFEVLVRGWSLDVAPSAEAYLDLTRESADEIDSALVKHFSEVVSPNKDELGKPSTSRASRRRG